MPTLAKRSSMVASGNGRAAVLLGPADHGALERHAATGSADGNGAVLAQLHDLRFEVGQRPGRELL